MNMTTVRQFIKEHNLLNEEEILSAFQKRINLTLIPQTSREEVPIGHSKFGGYPDLPSIEHRPDENLTFLAQFRLSDFKDCTSVDALPKEGLLLFFYDVEEQPWGDKDERHLWKVLYTEETDLKRIRTGEPLNERAISFDESYAPNIDTLFNLMTEDEFTALEEIFDEGEVHAIGGHPDAIQNDVFEEVEDTYGDIFKDPFLLFQMDSTEELDIMFGDAGILYFLIPTEALKERQFEETQIIMQCH